MRINSESINSTETLNERDTLPTVSDRLANHVTEHLADRLTEIEIRITRQDDLVDQLNAVICDQQKQIDGLILKLRSLEKQSEDPTAPRNEKPPHY